MQIENIHWYPEDRLYRYNISAEKVSRHGNEIPIPSYLNPIIKWYIEVYWPSIPKTHEISAFFISATGTPATGNTILRRVKLFIAKLFENSNVKPLDFRRMLPTLAMSKLRVRDANPSTNLFISTLANLMNCSTTILMQHYVREVPVQSLHDVQNILHEHIFGSEASNEVLKNIRKQHTTPEQKHINDEVDIKFAEMEDIDQQMEALKRRKEQLRDEIQEILQTKQVFPKVDLVELYGKQKKKQNKVTKIKKPVKIVQEENKIETRQAAAKRKLNVSNLEEKNDNESEPEIPQQVDIIENSNSASEQESEQELEQELEPASEEELEQTLEPASEEEPDSEAEAGGSEPILISDSESNRDSEYY
jgi:hypothetical protein